MADTHINAFFADVDEKEKTVLAAHAEWEAAKVRLEAKKKEVGFEDPTTPEVSKPQVEEKSDEVEETKPANNSLFGKKR